MSEKLDQLRKSIIANIDTVLPADRSAGGQLISAMRSLAAQQLVMIITDSDNDAEHDRLNRLSGLLIAASRDEAETVAFYVTSAREICKFPTWDDDHSLPLPNLVDAVALSIFALQMVHTANALMHHDVPEMIVWAAGNPKFRPGPCGCMIMGQESDRAQGQDEQPEQVRGTLQEALDDGLPQRGDGITRSDGSRSVVSMIIGFSFDGAWLVEDIDGSQYKVKTSADGRTWEALR